MAQVGDKKYEGWAMVSSGLAAVWARENTREALFDAMERKETYATTGSRMLVRFFGGWEFTKQDTLGRLPWRRRLHEGRPPWGAISRRARRHGPDVPTWPPSRTALSGNLDRIQIVKGWVDRSGERHEKVYNVAWSGDREVDADGALPAVGNTVDVKNATWTNTIGARSLIEGLDRPRLRSGGLGRLLRRVLEIPTPRWTAYEAQRFGVTMLPEVPMTTRERAYTSPIWYTP